jgi:hypothetical protein
MSYFCNELNCFCKVFKFYSIARGITLNVFDQALSMYYSQGTKVMFISNFRFHSFFLEFFKQIWILQSKYIIRHITQDKGIYAMHK